MSLSIIFFARPSTIAVLPVPGSPTSTGLFFVLLDTFIDSYYYYFEHLREQIGELDTEILRDTNENHIQKIYDLKNELTSIRKNLFPLKTSIQELLTDDSDLIEEDNFKYFNDCKDHINELIEYYNSFGEMINNLVTLNENNLNNNTNKVMKLLTIIATIFIPLTFIAGIYGMNFQFMPELEWRYGYFIALSLMVLTGVVILLIMKRKKWI
jgi:magnesium transporter